MIKYSISSVGGNRALLHHFHTCYKAIQYMFDKLIYNSCFIPQNPTNRTVQTEKMVFPVTISGTDGNPAVFGTDSKRFSVQRAAVFGTESKRFLVQRASGFRYREPRFSVQRAKLVLSLKV